MRRLLSLVTAGLLLSGTAFAQTAQPVLIGQGSSPTGTQGSTSNGEDALAQVPNQTGGLNPLLVGGLITIAIAVPIAIAVSNNDTDATVSP